jgi:hypothetical protein
MKIRPTRIAIIFSLILAIVAIYFLVFDNSSSINPMVKDFSFGRVDNITEIHLTDKIHSITLLKGKTGWLANGKYKVKSNLPELFLNTINSITVKSPASKAIRNQLRDQLVNSIHIDIFKGNHKVCSYYILYDSAYTQGTYLMKKWAKLPLEAEIAGIRFPIANLYHSDLDYWKAKFVFPFAADQIEWVSFENSASTSNSFKLERLAGSGVKLISLRSNTVQDKIDLIAINDYFSSLTKVQYLKEVEAGDSIDMEHTKSDYTHYTISLKMAGQNPIQLKFLPLYKKGKLHPDLFVGLSSLSSTPFIGKYADFDSIIRDLNYFMNK